MMVFSIVLILAQPALALDRLGSIDIPDKTNGTINLITLQYEAIEKSSLENPVVDPNFNTMRDEGMNKVTATIIVVGVLLVATVAPLVTWWYFSK